jgi:hypothetical protein
MKRQKQWIGLLLCGVIVLVAGYCCHRAAFANLHVVFAEQEDLKLFPELGREINFCLGVMMSAIIILATSTAILLGRPPKNRQKDNLE